MGTPKRKQAVSKSRRPMPSVPKTGPSCVPRDPRSIDSWLNDIKKIYPIPPWTGPIVINEKGQDKIEVILKRGGGVVEFLTRWVSIRKNARTGHIVGFAIHNVSKIVNSPVYQGFGKEDTL